MFFILLILTEIITNKFKSDVHGQLKSLLKSQTTVFVYFSIILMTTCIIENMTLITLFVKFAAKKTKINCCISVCWFQLFTKKHCEMMYRNIKGMHCIE